MWVILFRLSIRQIFKLELKGFTVARPSMMQGLALVYTDKSGSLDTGELGKSNVLTSNSEV